MYISADNGASRGFEGVFSRSHYLDDFPEANASRILPCAPSKAPLSADPYRACSHIGNHVNYLMRVIAIRTLKFFWERHPDAERPLRAWYGEAKKAQWQGLQDIKAEYRTASILRNNRVVFNIKGNIYRLVIAVRYEFQIAYIRFIGTHAEYDKIDAGEI